MKIAKTIMAVVLLLGMGSAVNAASTYFTTTTIYGVSDSLLDIAFKWKGDAPTGQENLDISPLLPYWDIDVKTNPGKSTEPKGIWVRVKHEGVGEGRTHYFKDAFSDKNGTLNWTIPHNGTDRYSLSYVSLTGSGPYSGAVLHLTGKHVAPVPVPAALWLFGSGLLAVVGFGKLRRKEIAVAG